MKIKYFLEILRILWYKEIVVMAYPHTPKLILPMKKWQVNDIKHLQHQNYSGVDWGFHLGEDCLIRAGTPVRSIGRGKVVYSALHSSSNPPESEGKRGSNWGNIIIIAHKHPKSKLVFFSLYGHLGERLVEKGDRVEIDQKIGKVAKGWTKENGWWKQAHLHFAIYVGPWRGKVLPGAYYDGSERTKTTHWVSPTKFIEDYNNSNKGGE